jgi:N-acetyl-anhydromuramyl-L-alanine amidase AmpD
MLSSLRRKKGSAAILVACVLIYSCGQKQAVRETIQSPAPVLNKIQPPTVDTFPVLSEKKLELTAAYNKEHYGYDSYRLDTPRIIVVHYTAIDDLNATLNLFRQDNINQSRDYIKDFSSLNVGIQYVIDKDGSIFHLTPDTVVARHLIGFNHVSLGIENIAADSTGLTTAQLESNAQLIRFLADKYPTIQYMIGHHEYNNKDLPHYKLFRSLNPAYKPYGKIDPGDWFMKKLRNRLAADGVVLEK